MREFDTGATRNDNAEKFGITGFRSRYADEAYYAYMHGHRMQADGVLRDPDNWKKGMPIETYYEGLDRHHHDVFSIHESGQAFRRNEDGGEVGLEDALAAMLFNITGLLHEIGKAKLQAAEPAEKQETLADVRTATYECAHCGADMAPCRITCDAVGMVPDICPVGPDGMADWRLVEGAAAVPDESPMVRSDCAGCKWDNGGLYWECGHCDDKYSNWTAADVKE